LYDGELTIDTAIPIEIVSAVASASGALDAGAEVGKGYVRFSARSRTLAQTVINTLRRIYQHAIYILEAQETARRQAVEARNQEIREQMERFNAQYWREHIVELVDEGRIQCETELEREAMIRLLEQRSLTVRLNGLIVCIDNAGVSQPLMDYLAGVFDSDVRVQYEQKKGFQKTMPAEAIRKVHEVLIDALCERAQLMVNGREQSLFPLEVPVNGFGVSASDLRAWLAVHFDDRIVYLKNRKITFSDRAILESRFYFLFGEQWPDLSAEALQARRMRILEEEGERVRTQVIALENLRISHSEVRQILANLLRDQSHIVMSYEKEDAAFNLLTDHAILLHQNTFFSITNFGNQRVTIRYTGEGQATRDDFQRLVDELERIAREAANQGAEFDTTLADIEPPAGTELVDSTTQDTVMDDLPEVVAEIVEALREITYPGTAAFVLDSDVGRLLQYAWLTSGLNRPHRLTFRLNEKKNEFYINLDEDLDENDYSEIRQYLIQAYSQWLASEADTPVEEDPSELAAHIVTGLERSNGRATWRLTTPEAQLLVQQETALQRSGITLNRTEHAVFLTKDGGWDDGALSQLRTVLLGGEIAETGGDHDGFPMEVSEADLADLLGSPEVAGIICHLRDQDASLRVDGDDNIFTVLAGYNQLYREGAPHYADRCQNVFVGVRNNAIIYIVDRNSVSLREDLAALTERLVIAQIIQVCQRLDLYDSVTYPAQSYIGRLLAEAEESFSGIRAGVAMTIESDTIALCRNGNVDKSMIYIFLNLACSKITLLPPAAA